MKGFNTTWWDLGGTMGVEMEWAEVIKDAAVRTGDPSDHRSRLYPGLRMMFLKFKVPQHSYQLCHMTTFYQYTPRCVYMTASPTLWVANLFQDVSQESRPEAMLGGYYWTWNVHISVAVSLQRCGEWGTLRRWKNLIDSKGYRFGAQLHVELMWVWPLF